MADKPEGRRAGTWTDWAAHAAPWASLLLALAECLERWVLPHV
ncbi:hypothetical protein [Streptomyces sp. NPDC029674]